MRPWLHSDTLLSATHQYNYELSSAPVSREVADSYPGPAWANNQYDAYPLPSPSKLFTQGLWYRFNFTSSLRYLLQLSIQYLSALMRSSYRTAISFKKIWQVDQFYEKLGPSRCKSIHSLKIITEVLKVGVFDIPCETQVCRHLFSGAPPCEQREPLQRPEVESHSLLNKSFSNNNYITTLTSFVLKRVNDCYILQLLEYE